MSETALPVETLLARWQAVAAAAFEAEQSVPLARSLNVELPPTKTAPRRRIVWEPTPGRIAAGRLTIIGGRSIDPYLVRQFGADGGLAFPPAKLSRGSDPPEDSPALFIAAAGGFDGCTCKGHARHGHCKHLDACQAICDVQAVYASESPSGPNAAPGYKHLTARDLANDDAFRL